MPPITPADGPVAGAPLPPRSPRCCCPVPTLSPCSLSDTLCRWLTLDRARWHCAVLAVNGASGYIGSHICLTLVKKGYHVRACVRNPSDFPKTT